MSDRQNLLRQTTRLFADGLVSARDRDQHELEDARLPILSQALEDRLGVPDREVRRGSGVPEIRARARATCCTSGSSQVPKKNGTPAP
jgi:hypothetical protein